MGVRTRSSAPSSPVKSQSAAKQTALEDQSPLKLFILPKAASPEARFLLLKHPRDGQKQRFLFCPSCGLYEITRVSTSSIDSRSILLTPNVEPISEPASDSTPKWNETAPKGYVNKTAEYFIATPFDLIFWLTALLNAERTPTRTRNSNTLFKPLEDILEQDLEDTHLRYLYDNGKRFLEKAATTICDVVDAGDERMFRFSETKLLRVLIQKAKTAVDRDLPASLEEQYVRRFLEKPVLSVKREEQSISVVPEGSNQDSHAGFTEYHSSLTSLTMSLNIPEASSVMAIDEQTSIPINVLGLQRLRTAFSFITSSYLGPSLAKRLTNELSSKGSSVNFESLDSYVTEIASLREEALAFRSFQDLSRKRGFDEDEDVQSRAEKRHKHEDDEKRKRAGESRGAKELKKADISGMKKLSAFFAKAPVGKAKS